jgi:hypothetical protein
MKNARKSEIIYKTQNGRDDSRLIINLIKVFLKAMIKLAGKAQK